MAARSEEPVAPFAAECGALFDTLTAGLRDMQESNGSHFRVMRTPSSLTISAYGKDYALTVGTLAGREVTYASPRSAGHGGGTHSYVLDRKRGDWVSTSDKHFLTELLTRDLLQPPNKGYPTF
jgi:hypothetical protein